VRCTYLSFAIRLLHLVPKQNVFGAEHLLIQFTLGTLLLMCLRLMEY